MIRAYTAAALVGSGACGAIGGVLVKIGLADFAPPHFAMALVLLMIGAFGMRNLR